MGYGMASNLRKKMPSTFTLFIHDISEQVCHRFVSEFSQHGSIRIAHSAKHAAHAGACLFVSSLPSVAAVRNVYLDAADGLVGAPADPNRLILETSTIESSESQAIAETLSEAGAGRYLDAPVSVSRIPPATAGFPGKTRR
jgi:3-hydroxyisobutyrate dehydrogenase